MAYTTIDDPSAYFQIAIWTGNGSTQDITFDGNSDLQPDFLWVNGRSLAEGHTLQNSLRGVTKHFHSQNTDGEATDTGIVTAFNSDGFSLGDEGDVNANTSTFVGWGWKCDTSFTNDASSTSIGTIDSAGKVNDTAGFSIITYTGTGSNGTIKHGLSTAPKMIITHQIAGGEWYVYHAGGASDAETDYLNLHVNAAAADDAEMWNDTAPTTSVFSVGVNGNTNGSSDPTIAFCFAEKQGYSKFGSYIGNGNADGTFVHTGFKPAFIMLKNVSRGASWLMFDKKRLGYNVDNNEVVADTSAAEQTYDQLDILSNGFKLRTNGTSSNLNADRYIYLAFAESPFVTSTGLPTTAR
jgi:hypothetical protein